MHYHLRTLERLLKVPPPDLTPPLSARSLPSSVAEWYSLPKGIDWLSQFSNGEWAIAPDDFDTHIMHVQGRRVHFASPAVHRVDGAVLRVFLVETQGVCWWAFSDKDDDPPVYVTWRPPPEEWQLCSDTFATFVYARIFDHLRFFQDGLFHTEVTEPVPESTLAYLDSHFEPEPTTRNPGGFLERRFSRGEQRITISGQLWMISADSPRSLQSLGGELSAFLDEFPPAPENA